MSTTPGTGTTMPSPGTPPAAGPSLLPQNDIWSNFVTSVGGNGILKTLFDHNRFASLAVIGFIALVAWFYGTSPTINSPIPGANGVRVTAAELQADLATYVSLKKTEIANIQADMDQRKQQVNAAFAQYQAEQAKLATLVNTVTSLLSAVPGAAPFMPLLTIGAGLLTAGFAADGARKTTLAAGPNGQSS